MKFNNTSALMGAALSFSGFSLMSYGDTILKYVGQEYGVFVLCFWNSLFGLIIIGAMAHFNGGMKKNLLTTKPYLHFIRASLIAINALVFFYALIGMPMTKAFVLIMTVPFVTTLLSMVVTGEKIGFYRWLTIAGGFIGVLIILRPGYMQVDWPTVCILIAVVTMSIVNLISGKIGQDEPWYTFSFYSFVALLPMASALCLYYGWIVPDYKSLGLLAAAGGFIGVGCMLMSRAFAIAPSSVVAPFHYCQLVWAALFGWVVFAEIPSIWTIVGGAVIVASGLYLIYKEHQINRENLTKIEHNAAGSA